MEGLKKVGCNNPDRDEDRRKKLTRVRESLQKSYVWEEQKTTRKDKKGLEMRELIMEIKKEIMRKGEKNKNSVKRGIITKRVRNGKKK